MHGLECSSHKNMAHLYIWILISLMLIHYSYSQNFQENTKASLCSSKNFDINLPCMCSRDGANGTVINCDGITFLGDFPVLPHRQKIHSFSQSASGLQSLEAQLFTASDIPLQRVDFSNNLLRRLTERTFEGVEDTLKTIYLQNNKLGDQLNSLFATEEFQRLSSLEILDLSGNGIKDFKAGIFNGLLNLKTLNLERNLLAMVPRSALQGLKSLQFLHLQSNNILDIGALSFPELTNLQMVNLSSNDIVAVHNGAFSQLQNLKTIVLSNNQIELLESNFLEGLNILEHLDLSQNLLESIPMILESKPSLKTLILYSNKIRSLNHIPLDKFQSLEYLDLRRNRIFEIPPNRFANLRNLKELHLDVNAIRKVTNEMFLGLENLSDLTLNDNRILAFPSEPLNIFKNFRKLNLDYNRIAAVSREILAPAKLNKELSLAFNLISEIPDGTFKDFKNLELLNLHGNKISDISRRKIEGLEQSLLYLDVGYNELSELPLLNFSNLLILSVAKNKITKIKTENLAFISKILHLNFSYNFLSDLQSDYFTNLKNMQSLDLQHNHITTIPPSTFEKLSVNEISLKNNKLRIINEETFKDLFLLKTLDLSYNFIEKISKNAFSSTPSIEVLNLMENSLNAIRGDEFSSETNIQSLILSHNKINYLYPKTFDAFPNVKFLDLSFNELTVFPRETVNNLGFLTRINLSGNKLHSIGDGYFANMPFLSRIDLQNNAITSISEFAFLNSSTLRKIYLQNNNVTSIHENAFIGLNRLELDVSNNSLSKLPNNIFSRSKGLKLESINIASNNLKEFPNEALKRQYSFLEKLNISFNTINNLPSNADVLVNIKELDISYNPLLPDAHYALFGEPKSVRKLYVQGTGLTNLPTIECPFLRELNIKENQLSRINTNTFDRTNMLSYLDVSDNKITDVNSNFNGWLKLSNLKTLDLCGNPIRHVSKTDFNHLLHLRELKMCNLKDLTEINCDSLHSLPRLRELYMYGFTNLQNFDVKLCLQNLSSLNTLEVEMKDSLLKNQLQTVFSPKLDTLSVTGQRLRSVSSSAFAGMLGPTIKIQLIETSIDTFTDKIFLPLPLSSKIEFKIPSNKIQKLTLEMLSVLDNKQVDLVVYGLNSNPIKCDCNIHFLWNWLQEKTNTTSKYHVGYEMINKLKCHDPVALRNQKLKDVKLDELVCHESTSAKSTEVTFETTSMSTSILRETSTTRKHPLIIFEQPITKKPVVPQSYVPTSDTRSTLTKVDTMIIGIVAGVVAFVCILIIIICIIRLRRAHPLYTAGPLAGPLAFRAQGKCTCLKPPPNNCTCYPIYTMPYAGRPALPNTQHKMLPPSLPSPPGFLATGHSGRLRNTPYYVTYPDSDNENK